MAMWPTVIMSSHTSWEAVGVSTMKTHGNVTHAWTAGVTITNTMTYGMSRYRCKKGIGACYMTNKLKIIRISSTAGDWEAYYDNDGHIIAQNHVVSGRDLLLGLGFDFESYEKDDEWFDEHGNYCPSTIDPNNI